MPADRELALPGTGFRARDFARRHGLAGFWRWWTRELSALVPAGPRAAVQKRRMRPVIEFDGDVATFWRPAAESGSLRMVETARITLGGDSAALAAEGRRALASVLRGTPTAVHSPKVVVALSGRTVLRKKLFLPAAVEDDLKATIGYDLDRHTPFKAEELYYDATAVARDNARGQITVDLAAARRSQVDAAVKHAQSWGAVVTAVVPEAPSVASTSQLNLLAADLRNGATSWRRWQFWLPVGLLAAAALIAIALPVWQKREYAIALNGAAAQAFQQAAVSESLRTQLDRQVGDYNFALEKKYAYPGAVQILEDVSRLLPDDTWLTQFEIKTNGRGKDMQRELMVRGESVNAGRLVTLLEESRLFTQAAPRSPTTKIQPGPGEIFDLGAQMRPLPSPTPVPLAPVDKPAAAAAAPSAPAANADAASPPPAAPAAAAKAAANAKAGPAVADTTSNPRPPAAPPVASAQTPAPSAAAAPSPQPAIPGRDPLDDTRVRGAPLPQKGEAPAAPQRVNADGGATKDSAVEAPAGRGRT